MENNLNEASLNEILASSDNNLIPDITDILSSGNLNKKKKLPRKSILDIDVSEEIPLSEVPESIPQVQNKIPQIQVNIQQIPNKIQIPQPIEEQYKQNVLNSIIDQEAFEVKKQNIRENIKARSKVKHKAENIAPEKLQEVNQQIKQEYEDLSGKQFPENINYVETEQEINEALEEIPGNELIDIVNLDIKPLPEKKDKSGYFKTKVSLKKENIPQQINDIASLVRSKTKGLLSPRICDLRVIGNTNKTQLKGSQLKLSATTIVFKPDFTKLKVNKGTRIMLSIPENYGSTGNLLVYIQESRAKSILEIDSTDFPTKADFNQFVSDRISEYYTVGYIVTLKKLQLRNTNNPLMQLVDNISKLNEYKIHPYVDSENHLYAIDFTTKGTENSWLVVGIEEADIEGFYHIIAKNLVDKAWEYKISTKPVTINQLIKNLHSILIQCFEKDWSKLLSESGLDEIYYLYGKLSHQKLKKALLYINDKKESDPELNIIIKQTLSKTDLSKSGNVDYDAELIIGKTNFIDYYILSFYAHQIIGGDKRKGSQYISREQYHEKYNIKNTKSGEERSKTLDRNYNSRIYLFQLEYSVNGNKITYRNDKFDDLLTETRFLSNDPNTNPQSKY